MKNEHLITAAALLYLLHQMGRKNAAVGAVYPEIPALYECNDGTYSTSNSARACSWHGGLKSRTPVQLTDSYSGLITIRDVPLEDIHIDTRLFQGRQKEYSERSVANIVNDVRAGRFLWENLDPITLWANTAGKLYLLSGHSRYEAFRRLAEFGESAQGKAFTRIPAKILKNVPVDVAQTVALESNTLSTKETDVERATYYRKLRQDGAQEKTILETIKKNEGKNWTNIYAYTFLSPNGATWSTLKQFGESEDSSAKTAQTLARWIGQARRQFTDLTNENEQELYAFLFQDGGYGTGPRQVNSENIFLEKVREWTFGLQPGELLNIRNKMQRSPVQQQYDAQVREAQQEVMEADKALKNEIRRLTEAGADQKTAQQITLGLQTRLTAARLALQRLLAKRDEVLSYAQNEPTLFGVRGIRRRHTLKYV